MTFKDSMTDLQVPTQALTNKRENLPETTQQPVPRLPRVGWPQAYATKENVPSPVCQGYHTGYKCLVLYQRQIHY